MIDNFKYLIDRVFSGRYIHAEVNIVQLVMYRFAYPFAVLLSRLGMSANLITSLSLVFSLLAFVALAFDDGRTWFAIFWGISVLLDFCDGTVARMTDKVSKTAFRYDHMSDIFKLCLVVTGVGIRNDDLLFWVLCVIFVFTYTYSEILSHDLISRIKREPVDLTENSADILVVSENRDDLPDADRRRLRERFIMARLLVERAPWSIGLIKGLRAVLFSFNGHTLLFFFLLPVGGLITIGTLVYLIALTLVSVITSINSLRCMSR